MSFGAEDAGAAPLSAAARSAFCAAMKTCCSTNCERSFACVMTWRVRRATYSPEINATTTSTSEAVASVNLFFRLNVIFARSLVLFQLVMQRFQADPQQLGGACLILIGGLKRLQNEFALRGFYGCAGRKTKPRKFPGLRHRAARKVLRQVLPSNRAVITGDGGAFQHVAKFADIPGPRIRFEELHHVGIDPAGLNPVFLVHFFQQLLDQRSQIIFVFA